MEFSKKLSHLKAAISSASSKRIARDGQTSSIPAFDAGETHAMPRGAAWIKGFRNVKSWGVYIVAARTHYPVKQGE